MDGKLALNILKLLYPIGKERWVKVRYNDFDWCVDNLKHFENEEENPLGISVTAIGVRDEHVPQIEALEELNQAVLSYIDSEMFQGRVSGHTSYGIVSD